jgi:tRNA(Ile)-lysidine synthetase-like protein
MQQLLGQMRLAVDKYNMIDENDKIAIGVSGGKDSMVLLTLMANLKKFYPKKFDLHAIVIDPCFKNIETDYSKLFNFCESLNISISVKRTDLYSIIFETRKEKNPCSLCARMRRGMLHDLTKEHGCNKIALGHHLDDAVETYYMNLFEGGRIASFSPVTYLSRKDIYMIRPLVLSEENKITNLAKKLNLPITKSMCPVDKKTNRQRTKELIVSLSKEYPGIKSKTIGAIMRAGISGW